MQLTFDYEDIKDVLKTMNITIHDVYFSSHATSSKIISTYMYWIAPANVFNYYQDLPCIHLSLQIKGKWLDAEAVSLTGLVYDSLFENDILNWLKTQKYVNCRYYIDGTGTGSIGALDQEYFE